jgi:hypothetical protein
VPALQRCLRWKCRGTRLAHRPDDGGGKHLRSVDVFPSDYTVQETRSQLSLSSIYFPI